MKERACIHVDGTRWRPKYAAHPSTRPTQRYAHTHLNHIPIMNQSIAYRMPKASCPSHAASPIHIHTSTCPSTHTANAPTSRTTIVTHALLPDAEGLLLQDVVLHGPVDRLEPVQELAPLRPETFVKKGGAAAMGATCG